MRPGEVLAIWFRDEAAKRFLGIEDKNHPVSRWVVVCTITDTTTTPIGVWVDVHRFEERRPETSDTEKRVIWGVNPSHCLIRYEYMTTAQRLQDAPSPEPPPSPETPRATQTQTF